MRSLLPQTLIALSLTWLGAPGQAQAGSNDFVLHRFRACGGVAGACARGIVRERVYDMTDPVPNHVVRVIPDTASFGSFARELGIALAPRMLEPAESPGQAGFSFGVATSVTDIKNEEEYWATAVPIDGQVPPDVLTTLHMHLRKGLPFSFEMGGTITYLIGSEMFALGADAKWTLNEGFVFLPDIAARASVTRLVGSRDLDLITGGGDVTISHPFVIGGMVVLTPYAGWNRLIVNASSHVLDATPGLDGFPPPHCNTRPGDASRGADPSSNYTEECVRAVESVETTDLKANFVLAQQRKDLNRFFGGMRFKFTVVTLTAEASFGDGVNSYTGKLELDF